jgi:hypothetical protein
MGRQTAGNVWVDLKLGPRFIFNPSLSFERMDELDTGEEIFTDYVLRVRSNFQFTRRLFLRLILQYRDYRKNYDVEPLLSYKVNPFTVFYAGSAHGLHDFPGDGELRETHRRYFLKFQYLFQT